MLPLWLLVFLFLYFFNLLFNFIILETIQKLDSAHCFLRNTNCLKNRDVYTFGSKHRIHYLIKEVPYQNHNEQILLKLGRYVTLPLLLWYEALVSSTLRCPEQTLKYILSEIQENNIVGSLKYSYYSFLTHKRIYNLQITAYHKYHALA